MMLPGGQCRRVLLLGMSRSLPTMRPVIWFRELTLMAPATGLSMMMRAVWLLWLTRPVHARRCATGLSVRLLRRLIRWDVRFRVSSTIWEMLPQRFCLMGLPGVLNMMRSRVWWRLLTLPGVSGPVSMTSPASWRLRLTRWATGWLPRLTVRISGLP